MKNIMKATVLLILILMVFSCSLFEDQPEVIIASRIDSFESDLNNGNYSNLQNHLHPDMISYDSYSDPAVIMTGPLAEANKNFTFGLAVSKKSGNDYIAGGNFSSDGGADTEYVAVMRETGDDWKILTMTIDPDSSDPYIIKTLK